VPEIANQSPRPWRADSLAVPLLIVIAGGMVAVVLMPRWSGIVFGLLLAISLPAMSVALWNFPTLIESFESESRDRALMRTVFRQHSEHLLSAGTPDRLAELGNKAVREDYLLMREHPLVQPFRYLVYGMWLVGIAAVACVVAQRGAWPRRLMVAGVWGVAGFVLAVAATWPRVLAEYHWSRASTLENSQQTTAADEALRSAVSAMPVMGHTWRFWLAKGRISYRQHEAENAYQAFFLAHQSALGGDLDRARTLMERYVSSSNGSVAQRDLLARILARQAAEYASDAKHGGAELMWRQASVIAPWKTAYSLAHGAAQLIAAPHRAEELSEKMLPRLEAVGDRMVASDINSVVGDAYFEIGEYALARQQYKRAMALFSLPKYSNVYAQEGRLGM
jgi:tetratricopeptide (TPR) repeat protein